MAMVPNADIAVETTNPQSKWKPPLAVTLAISVAFAIVFAFVWCAVCVLSVLVVWCCLLGYLCGCGFEGGCLLGWLFGCG